MNNQEISIIIADSDCELIARQLTAANTRTGMRVLDKVSDGESAIESIKKYQPDVVLLDICLPVLDGLGVMEQIRESGECPDTLFVIVTSPWIMYVFYQTIHRCYNLIISGQTLYN